MAQPLILAHERQRPVDHYKFKGSLPNIRNPNSVIQIQVWFWAPPHHIKTKQEIDLKVQEYIARL